MKRLLLSATLIILAAGCQMQLSGTQNTNHTNAVEVATYWLNYFPTQCNETPWGDTLEEQAIIAYYEALGVTIEAVEVTPEPVGFMTCAACGCSSGETISIQTDAVGRAILLEHGFTEEELAEPEYADDLPLNVNSEVDLNVNADTNTNAETVTTDEISGSELVDPATGVDLTETVTLSEADSNLQTRAEQLQMELTSYYSNHGSYPDDIAALNTTLDTAGLTYTPIGITPADYYDLSIDYSTGRVVVNP